MQVVVALALVAAGALARAAAAGMWVAVYSVAARESLRRALAARLEHEQDQQARLAAATERTRIAREVADIVTHSLSVMVTQADGAAGVSVSPPERAGQLMRQVAATGRQAIGEMRRTRRTRKGPR